jgi:GNAT superfamily N-acetyltransferase
MGTRRQDHSQQKGAKPTGLSPEEKRIAIQNAKTIESNDREAIVVRPMSWRDLRRLRDMHSRCSPETLTLSGSATLTEPKPPVTQVAHLLEWVLSQSKLLLSSIGCIRSFLAVIPRGAYLSHVAVNCNNEIVGFRTSNIVGRTTRKKYVVETTIRLRDDYQGKGLGFKFIVATLEMISPSVELVCSEVRRTNTRSLRALTRAGYTVIGTRTNRDGQEFYVLVIHLPLSEARRPRDSPLSSDVADSDTGHPRSGG